MMTPSTCSLSLPRGQVAQKKAAAIQQLPDLLACLGGPEAASCISPGVCCLPVPSACAPNRLPPRSGCFRCCCCAALLNRAEEGRVVTPRYCLLAADLRDPGQLGAALEAAGLDLSAPTYVLSECVLVYMQPQHR